MASPENFTFGQGEVLDQEGIENIPQISNVERPALLDMSMRLPPPIRTEVLEHRAEKYDYALGDKSPGRDMIRSDMLTGREPVLRRKMAVDKMNEEVEIKNSIIRQMAADKKGQPLSPEETDIIRNMTAQDMEDPQTYFEKQYAKKFVQDVAVQDMDERVVDIEGEDIQTSVFGEAFDEDPEAALQVLDAGEIIKTKQEIGLKLYQDYDAKWQKVGWFSGKGVSDTVEMLSPFVSEYRLTNLTGDQGTLWLGDNMQGSYEDLALIQDPAEYKRQVEKIAADLYAKNGYDAILFLKGLNNFNRSDRAFLNMLPVLDTLAISPVPIIGMPKVWGAAATRLQTSLKGAIKATADAVTSPVLAVEGAGNIEKAAMGAADRILSTRSLESGTPQNISEVIHQVPSVFNFGEWLGMNMGSLSRERASRIVEMATNNAARFWNAAFDSAVITGRITPGSVVEQAAKDDIRALLNEVYGRGSDVVMDVKFKDPEKSITGSAQMATIRLGNVGATPFDTREVADVYAREWYGLRGKYDVTEVPGGKWVIDVDRTVDETSPLVRGSRASMAVETRFETPKTYATYWLPWLRSKSMLVSPAMREELSAATVGGVQMAELAREMFKPIGRLSRRESERMEEFLSNQRDAVIKGERGYFSEGFAKFEEDWFKKFDQLPTDKEAKAYVTARQLNDMQWVLTNFSLYRDKSRKGFELFGGFGGYDTVIEGVLRKQDDLWKNVENAGILFYRDGNEVPEHFWKRWTPKEQLDELKKTLAEGQYRIIQISDVGEQTLRELIGDGIKDLGSVEFVITKDLTSKPLNFKQIPYRPGGHVGIERGHFARVPTIRKSYAGGATIHTYYGDKNFMHFESLKEAQIMVPRLNRLRELYLKRDIVTMKALLSQGYVPLTMKDLARSWGGKNPKYDPRIPIYITDINQSVESAHKLSQKPEYTNWHMKTDSPYDLYKGGVALEWTGKRGGHLYTIRSDGNFTNPTWVKEHARYIDAIPMLQRATDNLLRDRYLGEFKHNAAEMWFAEHKGLLRTSDPNYAKEVEANPLDALLNPRWDDKADKVALQAAKNSRRAVMEILHMPVDAFEEKTRYWQKAMVDDIYNRLGAAKGREHSEKLVTRTMLATADFPTFLRSFAFDWKLGMFNPVQLLLQSMTMVHTVGIAGPVNGMKGMEAAFIHSAGRLNEKHLAKMGKFAKGWDPQDVVDSYNKAKEWGWYRVGHEVATLADMTEEPLRTSRLGMVRDWGRFFFKEGERWARTVAWNTAFAEWRKANPGKVLSNADSKWMLERANLLSGQMLASSNAAWQKGIWGLPTQFMAYHARITEQFLDGGLFGNGILTQKEKLRLFATYSAVYGLPVAAGAPIGVWEVGRTAQEYFQEWGWDTDKNVFSKVFNDGLLSLAVEFATGTKTSIANRMGPGGLPFIEDLIDGDTHVLEAMGGVSGQSLFDTALAAEPLARILVGSMTGENSVFDLSIEDFADIARTSGVGNSVYKLIMGIGTGEYISKKGMELTDVTPLQTIMDVFFGAADIRMDDAYKRLENTKEREAAYKKVVDMASKEYRRAWRADNDEDKLKHIRRAQAYMTAAKLPHEWRQRALNQGMKGYEHQVRALNRKWADQDPEKLKRLIDESNGKR